MQVKKIILISLLICNNIQAKAPFILLRNFNYGMFSIVFAVMGLLDLYEKQEISGLKVDFYIQGLYYQSDYGLNWWEHYFESINIGQDLHDYTIEVTEDDSDYFGRAVAYAACRMSRERGYELINKYIKPKPHVKLEVDTFIKNNFDNYFVIGVHYRGTDKIVELQGYKLLDYEVVYEQILKSISKIDQPYKIFIASDELSFRNFMIERFGDKVIYNPQPLSADGRCLHVGSSTVGYGYSRYKLGLFAVVDSLLLAHTQLLIRTSSNFSHFSFLYNPNIPVITLNQSVDPVLVP